MGKNGKTQEGISTSRKIRQITRRLNWGLYLLLMALGMIMLAVAVIFVDGAVYPNLKSAIMNIGAGVVASAFVTLFLLIFLAPEDDEQKLEFERWGIEKIYSKRSEFKINAGNFPKNNLDIMAFGLSHFCEANRDSRRIIERINAGLKIRIITMNPNSPFLKEYSILENRSSMKKDVINLNEWVEKINKRVKSSEHKIEIKKYDTLPLMFYCRMDDEVYAGGYEIDFSTDDTLTYRFSEGGEGEKHYRQIFDGIWEGNKRVKTLEAYPERDELDAPRIDECIMKHLDVYSERIKGITNSESEVEGIIVFFKGDSRRTYISNKGKKGVVHGKKEGTIGIMLEHNADKGKHYIIYKDYGNQENVLVKTFDGREKDHNVEELPRARERVPFVSSGAESNKNVVIAVPLYSDERGKNMIGALTFDLLDVPVLIDKKFSAATKEEVECLEAVFEEVEQCRVFIEPLLGYGIYGNIKKFYDDEWRNGDDGE